MKTIRIGSGSGFWGDNLDPAIEIARHGNVQYLAYDFLGEPTIPLLQKMQKKNPAQGFVPSIRAVVRGVLPICLEKGIKILTNAGAANPQACADTILATARSWASPNSRSASSRRTTSSRRWRNCSTRA